MEIDFNRIAVKIGSNVLTRRDGTLDVTRMSALVDQIAELHKAGIEIILVSSGAVASGRSEVHPTKKLDSVDQRQLFSAVGQAKLINRYYELFREHGIPVGQVLTMKENFSTRRHYLNQKNCMTVMLENGVIPIVNENDTISTEEFGIGDNDTLSAMVSGLVDADLLILLSDIDGLYTANPRTHADARIIPVVENIDKHIYDIAGDAGSSMGTGGMYTKIQAAAIATAADVDMVIASGSEDGIISRICAGENVGTLFKAKETPLPSKKRWLVSGSKSKGRLIVDQGCRDAIIGHGSSLLPVGITAVEGIFDEGEIVSVVYDGLTIAKGISNYSSVNINAIKGLQSADIPKVLGHNGIYEEVIHRDNLVAMY